MLRRSHAIIMTDTPTPTSEGSPPAATPSEDLVKEKITFWRNGLHEWYPKLHDQTHLVPPLFFNQVPNSEVTVCGERVLVTKPPIGEDNADAKRHNGASHGVHENDFRDDRAQQHILFNLKWLGDNPKQVMMVISQLDFRKYLDGENDPIGSAAAALLPRANSLHKDFQRGDFDILIVHKKYGLIVGEVKSVGYKFQILGESEAGENKTIVNRVGRAVKQLNKCQKVLQHLVSDLPKKVMVTKTLFLPNITLHQLTRALGTNLKMEQDFVACLDASSLQDAVSRCLCADLISPSDTPWEVTDAAASCLAQWWDVCVTCPWSRWVTAELGGNEPSEEETRDLYEQLLARFCGPATTLEIPSVTPPRKQVTPRKVGEGLAELGTRMAQITLLPQQVTLLDSAKPPRVHIWGPPGTGKSAVLYLRGRGWLNQGHDVWVVSPGEKSLAASILIHHMLQQTVASPTSGSTTVGCAQFHQFDCKSDVERDNTVVKLTGAAKNGRLFVLVDEALSYWGDKTFNTFCNELNSGVPELFMWAASVHIPDLPDGFEKETLTVPMRCPPVVTREIQKARELSIWTGGYSEASTPAPTDGPEVKWLRHEGEPGHSGDRPSDCEQCGVSIADLLNELDVGSMNGGGLQKKDVLVLCDNPRDDETDDSGHVTPATAVVRGLRSRGFPVLVVKEGSPEESYRDVALAKSDVITVTHYSVVMGLERMVVVGMGNLDRMGERTKGMSRCTAQLVWIQ